MDRATFLRLIGTGLAAGAWWRPWPPAAAAGADGEAGWPAAAPRPAACVEADEAVAAAYAACTAGGWALALQERYLDAALAAAQAWRRHAPEDPWGQDYMRLAVDVATDVAWDPARAPRVDQALMAEAARFTLASPNGPAHPARARALLARIGLAR